MKKILDYLKITAVLVSVLVGVQVPAFVDQYGKNLHSRLLESNKSINEFKDDAEKFFNGDIQQLIAHYENKPDPVIAAGGESIGALFARNQYLAKALVEYKKSVYNAYLHVLLSPVDEIRTTVWSNYTYSVVLNKSAIIFGVCSGVASLMLFELTIFLFALIFNALFKSRKQSIAKGSS